MGMTRAANREEADFVIFSTPAASATMLRRALGNVVRLQGTEKTRPELMVHGVCGCMMQQSRGWASRFSKQYPFVDLAFGTHNLYRFAQLMLKRRCSPPPRGRGDSG